MHPFFVRRARLGLYLASWAPLGALLAALFVLVGGGRVWEALVLALPLTLVYAFLCLAAWYPCRALPLERGSMARIAAVHTGTASISSLAWVGLAWLLGQALAGLPGLPEPELQVNEQAVLIFAIGFLAYWLSVASHYLLAAFEASREAERRAMESHLSAKEAELAMLRAQVDPHFLFNSLNSISSLTVSDPEAARAMCIELGDFLRSTLRCSCLQRVSLAEELAMVRRYLAIEKLRFGERLQLEEDIADSCLGRPVLPMSLQPLVENSLKHGIAHLLEGGTLEIRARCSDSGLRVELGNPVDADSRARPGEGLGLRNLRQRLEAAYGDEAWLQLRRDERRFEVHLFIPDAGAKKMREGSA